MNRTIRSIHTSCTVPGTLHGNATQLHQQQQHQQQRAPVAIGLDMRTASPTAPCSPAPWREGSLNGYTSCFVSPMLYKLIDPYTPTFLCLLIPSTVIPLLSFSLPVVLLRGTIVNRTYGTHKNLCINPFLLTNIWSCLLWSPVIVVAQIRGQKAGYLFSPPSLVRRVPCFSFIAITKHHVLPSSTCTETFVSTRQALSPVDLAQSKESHENVAGRVRNIDLRPYNVSSFEANHKTIGGDRQ